MKRTRRVTLILIAIGAFSILGWSTQSNETFILQRDEAILISLGHLRTTPLNHIATALTALGSATLLCLFSFVGVIFFALKRKWRDIVYLLVVLVGSGVLSNVTKHLSARLRPTIIPPLMDETSFSYPSGHVLLGAGFYLTLAFIVCGYYSTNRAKAIVIGIAWLFILLISLSRVYLGVHYPSDVLGGLILGTAWAFCIKWLISHKNQN